MLSYKDYFSDDIRRLECKMERMFELGLHDIAIEIQEHLDELKIFLGGVE